MDSGATSLDRRDVLRGLAALLGGALSVPVTSAVLARSAAAQETGGDPWLATDRLRLVGALAERVLPRTDTPGALDARVDLYIDTIVGSYFSVEDRNLYLQGLDRVDRRSQERFGSTFVDCTAAQQDEIVAELDRLAYGSSAEAEPTEPSDGRFFRFHKELTVVGFYTSEVGQTQELREWRFGEYDADLEIGPNDKAFA